jgi:hypothetical protein
MRNLHPFVTNKRLLTAAAFFSLILVAGCDERVRITRDRDAHIAKGATWAWRPLVEEPAAVPTRQNPRDDRPVTSRDDVGRYPAPNRSAVRTPNPDDELVRGRVRAAIEQDLASKGFRQVPDPAAAEFLVDYKFGLRRRNETVPVYGGGAYPGLVCGPFRCWEGWGYGPAFVGYENVHFREGMIVFDFVEQPTRHLVYRAIGEKPVRYDAFTLTQGDVHGLVHLLLEDLKHQH